jgi:PAS domain S-box-containing protein
LSNERYRLAIKATKDVVWDWNLETQRLIRDVSYHKLSGYASNGEGTDAVNGSWENYIFSDDKGYHGSGTEPAAAKASEEQLRLAIESADLGTWFINTETREITPSPRLKELFGFYADEEMPLGEAINQIVEECREMVVEAINNAIEKGEGYDIQYPVIGFHDQKLRWVRATGKLYPSAGDQTPVFSGTISDITEQKQN